MSATTSPVPSLNLITALSERLRTTRRQTLEVSKPLTPEDMMVQSCPEASPAKWHIAHTTWFFESFVLREFLAGYGVFHADFEWLFNSYYESFSALPEKDDRSRGSTRFCATVSTWMRPWSGSLSKEQKRKRCGASNWARTTKSSTRNCCLRMFCMRFLRIR